VVGVSVVVEQSEATDHRGEIKARGWLQGSGDSGVSHSSHIALYNTGCP
jgi:hypothetical protein